MAKEYEQKRNEEHYRGEHFKWVYAIVRTKSYWILWGIVHNLCTLLVLFVFLSWFDGFSLSTHSQMCVRTYTMIQKWSHHWSCVNCWTNKSWQFGLKSENMFVSVNMWKGKNKNTHTRENPHETTSTNISSNEIYWQMWLSMCSHQKLDQFPTEWN